MTRDEMILMCREEGGNEDGVLWEVVFEIADERLSDEEDNSDFVPWSKRTCEF